MLDKFFDHPLVEVISGFGMLGFAADFWKGMMTRTEVTMITVMLTLVGIGFVLTGAARGTVRWMKRDSAGE